MPFGLGDLNFVDDVINSVMGGLDDLFTSDEERKKAQKQLEQVKKQLKLGVKEHTRKVLQIHAKDRQDARAAQDVALKKAWWVMPTLMILSFLGFFGVLASLIFLDSQIIAAEPLYIMLGTLGTIVTQIAHFLWGSSSGSKNKDAQIQRALEQADLRSANSGSVAPGSNDSSSDKSSLDKNVESVQPAPLEGSPETRVGW